MEIALVSEVPKSAELYLEVDDCSWHQGKNPRELSTWWIDLNGLQRFADKNRWTPKECLKPQSSVSLEWIAYCTMHDLYAICSSNGVKNTPGKDIIILR